MIDAATVGSLQYLVALHTSGFLTSIVSHNVDTRNRILSPQLGTTVLQYSPGLLKNDVVSH